MVKKVSDGNDEALLDLDTDDLLTDLGKDLLMKNLSNFAFSQHFDKKLLMGVIDVEPKLHFSKQQKRLVSFDSIVSSESLENSVVTEKGVIAGLEDCSPPRQHWHKIKLRKDRRSPRH